uniref:MYCBP-associated protein n=1 Tax=Clastoptera arizonana TaxID=38151 RepID=A0A1B6BY21_9HEMI
MGTKRQKYKFKNNYGKNQLKNYEKWLRRFNKQYQVLHKKINRTSKYLLMNKAINEKRYVNQEKIFIDKAKSYIKSDYYRGHPGFWKIPLSLKCLNENLLPCFITTENFDRTNQDPDPPILEFICTPNKILVEQGVEGVGKIDIVKWKDSNYVNKKLLKIQAITKTSFKRPDFEDLIVVGKKYLVKPSTVSNVCTLFPNSLAAEVLNVLNNDNMNLTINNLLSNYDKKEEIDDNLICINLTCKQKMDEHTTAKTCSEISMESKQDNPNASNLNETYKSLMAKVDNEVERKQVNLLDSKKEKHEVKKQILTNLHKNKEVNSFFKNKKETLDEQNCQNDPGSSKNNIEDIETAGPTETSLLKSFEVTIIFSNCNTDRYSKKVIKLVNENDISIKYEWYLYPNLCTTKLPLQKSNLSPKFFFNINSGVIIPGESKEFNIFYKSKTAGVYKESWEFRTKPSAYKEPIRINFEAITLNTTDNLKWKCFEKYIDNRVIESNTRNHMNRIMTVQNQQVPRYTYNDKLLEEEMFLHNNPDLFYEIKSVCILNDLNNRITSKNWDYSVQNLRTNILSVEDIHLKNKYLTIFKEHLKILMKPSQIFTIQKEKKYRTVYEILCNFVHQMEFEAIKLDKYFDDKVSDIESKRASLNYISDLKYSKLDGEHKNQKLKSIIIKHSILKKETPTSCDKKDTKVKLESETRKTNEIIFIKTYESLSQAIELIAAVIDSINSLHEKPIISCLGK